LVIVSAAFLWAHARNFLFDKELTSLPFTIEQSVLVWLFIIRRRSRHTSTRPFDWVVAMVGTWGSLLVRPWGDSPDPISTAGIAIQSVGLVCAAISLGTLGRSIGVVAANRGLKTIGPYRIVRHPAYASHTITLIGFVIANPHPWNFAIVCTVVAGLLLRIRAEERVLRETDDYATYQREVRWRLVPGIY
jgi:protein-S-isoprenylcysteine O-methyltransferase Ste14